MYSIDFIRRAVAYKDEGHTLRELKDAFNIPPETYYQWKEKLENGYIWNKSLPRTVTKDRQRETEKSRRGKTGYVSL